MQKYKVPEFDPPRVLDDDVQDSEDDEEWLFEPPPPEVRSREHIGNILGKKRRKTDKKLAAYIIKKIPSAGLNEPVGKDMTTLNEKTLKELKKVYENAIKPLETTYKYRELSNRHFGDPEIFNKPLVVLMGPWSGGKSTMINYLLGTEYTKNAFKSGKLYNKILRRVQTVIYVVSFL